MRIYIISTIHNGYDGLVLGNLLPTVCRSHDDALKICKEECEDDGYGVIIDDKTRTMFTFDEESNKWSKEHCEIDDDFLSEHEGGYFIAESELELNKWLIDM